MKNCNGAISLLQRGIGMHLDSLARLESTSEEDQSSLHYEHIHDEKEAILELRRAILILKYFNVEEVIKELLNNK